MLTVTVISPEAVLFEGDTDSVVALDVYTGRQKLIDTAGRVDKFEKKYAAYVSWKGQPEVTIGRVSISYQ